MEFNELLSEVSRLSSDQLAALQRHLAQVIATRSTDQPNVKIGIIADMHGDFVGFQKALAIFDRESITQIICAGDIVDRGPEADAIVQVIQERGIVCIAGNHDYTVLANQEKWRASDKPDRLRELGRIVSDDTAEFLQVLPANARLTIAGKRILIGHGTPWSDVMTVFHDSRQGVIKRIADDYGVDTDIVILGHTHTPMRMHVGNLYILNPGSIYGITIRDSHTCAILNLPTAEFTIYDIHTGQSIDVPVVER